MTAWSLRQNPLSAGDVRHQAKPKWADSTGVNHQSESTHAWPVPDPMPGTRCLARVPGPCEPDA